MVQLRLTRISNINKFGVFGVLTVNGDPFCVTLEPPDKQNKPNKSCIPAGMYSIAQKISPSYGTTWWVKDVPGRSNIIFHPGNTLSDTLGCILLAQRFGKLFGDRAVLNSGKTFREFQIMLKDDYVGTLTITESY